MDSISERQVRSDQPLAGLTIEPLLASKAAEVAAIAVQSFAHPWDAKDFAYFMGHPCASAWGVYVETDTERPLVTYFVGLLTLGDLDIVSIATGTHWRGRGLAERLVRHVIALPEVKSLMLEVDVDNQAAIRLYEKVGFQTMGIRKKYYANKHDALFMRLSVK